MGNELEVVEGEEVDAKKERPQKKAQLSQALQLQSNVPASVTTAAHAAAAEVIARVMSAHAIPRDEKVFETEMIALCQKPFFAEKAIYAVNVGSGNIEEGPSVHLAREMAKRYRNDEWDCIDHGVTTNDQDKPVGEYEVYFWDYERNSRNRQVLKIAIPDYAQGELKTWRFVGSFMQRTARNVIFDSMPQDLVQRCFEVALVTMDRQAKKLAENKADFLRQFKDIYNISEMSLCKFVRAKNTSDLSPTDIRRLMALKQSLDQGVWNPKDIDPKAIDAPVRSIKTGEIADTPFESKEKEKPAKPEKPKEKPKEKPAPPPAEPDEEENEAPPDDDEEGETEEADDDAQQDDAQQDNDSEPESDNNDSDEDEEKKPAPTKPRKRW